MLPRANFGHDRIKLQGEIDICLGESRCQITSASCLADVRRNRAANLGPRAAGAALRGRSHIENSVMHGTR